MEENKERRPSPRDRFAGALVSISHGVLVVVFGLLPLVFIPSQSADLGYTKALFVIAGLCIAFIAYSLSLLRTGEFTLHLHPALVSLWVIGIVSCVSAVLSGDLRDALMGDILSIHTAAFVLLLAASVTVIMFVRMQKEDIMRLFMLLSLSTILLVGYHLLRIVFGPGALTFGIFADQVATPLGGWNDLALFLGLVILLSLVTIEQLPLTKWGTLFFSVVVVAAMLMLAVINFSFVWIVLALVSIVVVVYTLSKGHARGDQRIAFIPIGKKLPLAALFLPLGVFVVSVTFILGGSFLGRVISQYTNVSYIEVRPSFSATADIARGVYHQDALLGIGPNKFVDAWRLYKDPSINETIFWSVDFPSGVGYIPTFFVTTGALGTLAWLIFLALFLYTGQRMLLRSRSEDRTWYYIGTASFVSAAFIWGMAFVYVPGSAILLLGALCTGLTFVADRALGTHGLRLLTLSVGKPSGFVLTLGVVASVVLCVGVLYETSVQFAAAYTFNQSIVLAQPGNTLDDVEARVAEAYNLSQNDVFARRIAEYQLARMNALLTVTDPTADTQQQFQSAVAAGINAGHLAVGADDTEPENWAVLGRIYAVLVSAGVDGAYDLGLDAFTHAKDLDPKNPLRELELAEIAARANKLDEARTDAEAAIAMKSNYSDALYFVSQLDIAQGDVASAITNARTIITLEPDNPTRYYQLGILAASQSDYETAAAALEAAVQLNSQYANARYVLALVYDQEKRPQDAIAQLQVVQQLNPDNQSVADLIEQLQTYGHITQTPANSDGQPVSEEETVSQNADNVSTTEAPDTPLVVPVNTPADSASETAE
jgi:tetratricopeptide (TPR) repeat protein